MFAINAASGNNDIDYHNIIHNFFEGKAGFKASLFNCEGADLKKCLKDKIAHEKPDVVVAVGGDGTVKLVAELVAGTNMKMAIIPAGSANGMAKELNIPQEPLAALETLTTAQAHPIHLLKINNQYCIHLSDIGFNAYIIKTFETLHQRGMWGYIKAAWKVLWRHSKMEARFEINNQMVKRSAVMIVLANATSYGTGVAINPDGKLDDDLFEIVIIRKISIAEILKMRFSRKGFNPQKTEFYQVRSVKIHSKRKAHFQIDGEYIGKVNEVIAELVPAIVNVIYPKTEEVIKNE